MLQATDRVLAKIMGRVLRDLTHRVIPNDIIGARLLTDLTLPYIEGNYELADGFSKLLREIAEEARAEAAGSAVPNVAPYPVDAPQPGSVDWD